MCITSVQCSQGQKKALGPQELELLMVVSCRWVLGTEFRASERAASILHCRIISPAPKLFFLREHIVKICILKGGWSLIEAM